MDTTKLFSNGDSNEFDATIIDVMEKKKSQVRARITSHSTM